MVPPPYIQSALGAGRLHMGTLTYCQQTRGSRSILRARRGYKTLRTKKRLTLAGVAVYFRTGFSAPPQNSHEPNSFRQPSPCPSNAHNAHTMNQGERMLPASIHALPNHKTTTPGETSAVCASVPLPRLHPTRPQPLYHWGDLRLPCS